MKKDYIKPEIEVVEVEVVNMLAESTGNDVDLEGKAPEEELVQKRRGKWGDLWFTE